LTVMKFGGSSLAAPSGMRRVGDIIERHAREHRVAVVVSASGDVTDRLIRAAQGAPGWSMREINGFLQELRRLHLDIIEGSGHPSTPLGPPPDRGNRERGNNLGGRWFHTAPRSRASLERGKLVNVTLALEVSSTGNLFSF